MRVLPILLLAILSFAAHAEPAKNLILVTVDGLRWQEVFRGIDERLINDKRYTKHPLWELTSSGLTEEWKAISPNHHRLRRATHRNNYGLIEINRDGSAPYLVASIKDEQGGILLQNTVRLSDLR